MGRNQHAVVTITSRWVRRVLRLTQYLTPRPCASIQTLRPRRVVPRQLRRIHIDRQITDITPEDLADGIRQPQEDHNDEIVIVREARLQKEEIIPCCRPPMAK